MSEQQRPVDTQRLLLAEPRAAVVGDGDQAARVLAPPPGLQRTLYSVQHKYNQTGHLDQEEDPGVGGDVQCDVHTQPVPQPRHAPASSSQ